MYRLLCWVEHQIDSSMRRRELQGHTSCPCSAATHSASTSERSSAHPTLAQHASKAGHNACPASCLTTARMTYLGCRRYTQVLRSKIRYCTFTLSPQFLTVSLHDCRLMNWFHKKSSVTIQLDPVLIRFSPRHPTYSSVIHLYDVLQSHLP